MKKQAERHGKRAAIYCRVSTQRQKRNSSLGTQESACRHFATTHGYTVAPQDTFREIHSGAELWERTQLTKLRALIREGEVGVVIVHALDRLSRSRAHFAIIAGECEQAGVALLFVAEQREQSEVGTAIGAGSAAAAELEHARVKERMLRGMRARIASGKLSSRTTPLYGYRFRDGSNAAFDLDTRTAPIVRRIFTEMANGESLRKIAERLTGEGVPPPGGGKRWYPSSLRRMLEREEYTGIALALKEENTRVGGRRVRSARPESERIVLPEGTIPALVDSTTYAIVQEHLRHNKTRVIRAHRHPERFLLHAGHVCCGYCGKSIGAYCGNVYQRKGRTYRVPDRYRANKHDTACSLVWHDAAPLDAAVWAEVISNLATPTILGALLEQRHTDDSGASARRALARSLDRLERKRANLLRAMASLDDRDSQAVLRAELTKLSVQ